MSDEIIDLANESLARIKESRSKIIEDYIEFWLAVHIPREYLTLQLLESLVLVEKNEGSQTKYWLEFIDPKDRMPKGD